MSGESVILLVDDSSEVEECFRQLFDMFGGLYQLQTVRSAAAAKTYLKRTGRYRDRQRYPVAQMVLLDLKMPRTDGFQVLQWIRQQPEFYHLPVIVLTDPNEIRQASRAYQIGANSFLLKPPTFDELRDLLQAFQG